MLIPYCQLYFVKLGGLINTVGKSAVLVLILKVIILKDEVGRDPNNK